VFLFVLAMGVRADQPVCASLVQLAGVKDSASQFNMYINGQFRPSTSERMQPVYAPFNGSKVYEVPACTQAEIDEAFESAKTAQKAWSRTPLWKRAELLKKAAAKMREHANEIAEVMMNEVAKPRKAALQEVLRTADIFEYTAEEGVRIAGSLLTSDSFPGEKRNKLALVSRVPLGVLVAIPPYNYPLNLAGSKVAPALMAGNALVMKPPSQGAVTGLVGVAAVFHLAGAPAGLLSVVTGKGAEIGDYITQHQHADIISFTGGSTGIRVARGAGMVPLQMELGGKDPAVVLPDADMELAAANIVKGAFSFSGQRCTGVKIVVVVEPEAMGSAPPLRPKGKESTLDRLLPLILKHTRALKAGHPAEEGVEITAVIDSKSADYIEGLVKDAVDKGASLLLPEGGFRREGNLIHPVVLTGIRAGMRLVYEEQFGPVLPIMTVGSAREAVDVCNGSPLGLQASVFTRSLDDAMILADEIQAGTVQINGAPARGPDHFPFQGFKDSGIGSQGVRWSIEAMTKVKSTVINLPRESYAQS